MQKNHFADLQKKSAMIDCKNELTKNDCAYLVKTYSLVKLRVIGNRKCFQVLCLCKNKANYNRMSVYRQINICYYTYVTFSGKCNAQTVMQYLTINHVQTCYGSIILCVIYINQEFNKLSKLDKLDKLGTTEFTVNNTIIQYNIIVIKSSSTMLSL